MSITANPVPLTLSTQFTLPLPGVVITQIDWIVLSNNSPFVLQVICGGILFHIPAWYFYPVPFISGKNRLFTAGNEIDITPIQQTIPGSKFTAQLFYTIYLNNETPPQTVPSPLGGGPTDLTVASQIINTGQPAGQNIVFAEPVGDSSPGGAVAITNSGFIGVGDTANSGKILVSGTHVALAATNNIFPDEIDIIGTNNQSVDLLVSGVDAFVALRNQLNTSIVKMQTSSPAIDLSAFGGAVALLLVRGSLTRLSVFTGSASSAGTLQAHNLGVKPDFCVFQETNTVGDPNTFSWDIAASDATNVKVWSNNATARNYIALAIKL